MKAGYKGTTGVESGYVYAPHVPQTKESSMILGHHYHKRPEQELGYHVIVLDPMWILEPDNRYGLRHWCRATFGPEGKNPDTWLTRWKDEIVQYGQCGIRIPWFLYRFIGILNLS